MAQNVELKEVARRGLIRAFLLRNFGRLSINMARCARLGILAQSLQERLRILPLQKGAAACIRAYLSRNGIHLGN